MPKTLVVYPVSKEREIHIPEDLISNKPEDPISNMIYLVLNCTKGSLKFPGMEHCSICGG